MEQRLIDVNKLTYEDMEDGYGNICLVVHAPTIIEADKESEDKE